MGQGGTVADLADAYGVSMASVRRCINMFLDAVDFNTDLPELQINLPSHDALPRLAEAWSSISTAFGLFPNTVGAINGWLPFLTAPSVDNQADYFSGHYKTHGLNVQAMCDPELLFNYVCVAAPGKTNDNRAMDRCTELTQTEG